MSRVAIVTLVDPHGQVRQIPLYDDKDLLECADSEGGLLDHIKWLHDIIGTRGGHLLTPRRGASRKDLVDHILDLQRRAIALHKEEAGANRNSNRQPGITNGGQQHQLHLQKREASASPQSQSRSQTPERNRENVDRPDTREDQQKRIHMLCAQVDEMSIKLDQLCLKNTDIGNFLEIREECRQCKAMIRDEKDSREKASAALDAQWRALFSEESERIAKQITNVSQRCDKELRDLQAEVRDIKSDYPNRLSSLNKAIKADISDVTVSIDKISSSLKERMAHLEESLPILADRAAGEINTTRLSVQKLQKESEEEESLRVSSVQQLQKMMGTELNKLEEALMKEATKRGQADEKIEKLEKQLRVSERETQSLEKNVDTRLIEFRTSLENNYSIEKTRVAKQICELMNGLRATCDALDRQQQSKEQQSKEDKTGSPKQIRSGEFGDIAHQLASQADKVAEQSRRRQPTAPGTSPQTVAHSNFKALTPEAQNSQRRPERSSP